MVRSVQESAVFRRFKMKLIHTGCRDVFQKTESVAESFFSGRTETVRGRFSPRVVQRIFRIHPGETVRVKYHDPGTDPDVARMEFVQHFIPEFRVVPPQQFRFGGTQRSVPPGI